MRNRRKASRARRPLCLLLLAVSSFALLGLAAGALDSRHLPMGDVPHRLRSRHIKAPNLHRLHRRAGPTEQPPEIFIMGPEGGVRVTGEAPDEAIEVFEPDGPGDGDEDDVISADVGTQAVEYVGITAVSPDTATPEDLAQVNTDSSVLNFDSVSATSVQDPSTQPDTISIDLITPMESPDISTHENPLDETPAPEPSTYLEIETSGTGMFNTAQGQDEAQVDTTSTGIFSTAQSQDEVDTIGSGRYSTGAR